MKYHHSQQHDRVSAAFSLVELVAVIVIMGLLAAVAVPRYAAAANRYHLSFATQRIAADLELARSRAIQSSTTTSIKFDPLTHTYTLTGFTTVDRAGNTRVVNMADDPYDVTLHSANFDGTFVAEFDGFGKPTSAGSVVLVRGGQRYQVSLAANGQVTVP